MQRALREAVAACLTPKRLVTVNMMLMNGGLRGAASIGGGIRGAGRSPTVPAPVPVTHLGVLRPPLHSQTCPYSSNLRGGRQLTVVHVSRPTASGAGAGAGGPADKAPRTFEQLGLSAALVSALHGMGISEPTDIQVRRDELGGGSSGGGRGGVQGAVAAALRRRNCCDGGGVRIRGLTQTHIKQAAVSELYALREDASRQGKLRKKSQRNKLDTRGLSRRPLSHTHDFHTRAARAPTPGPLPAPHSPQHPLSLLPFPLCVCVCMCTFVCVYGMCVSMCVSRTQSLALPALLGAPGNYFLASHTGSGKTLAYLLPLVREGGREERRLCGRRKQQEEQQQEEREEGGWRGGGSGRCQCLQLLG